jgi:hypothetical protein
MNDALLSIPILLLLLGTMYQKKMTNAEEDDKLGLL